MFTGIVQAVGKIVRIEQVGGDARLKIDATSLALDDVAVGDSICVSGVCLTVEAREGSHFAADVSLETLSCTTLGSFQAGAAVNLE